MRINYRPEIDGLRAVAVLSVIFYHAKITIFGHLPFKGGFVGVDIFFVISVSLITNLVFDDLSNNKFSFADFYSRRIRRIFPALILVLFTVAISGWILLFTQEFQQLGQHVKKTALFI